MSNNPDYQDYIYSVEALATLAGSRYKPKRNHINHFVARNDWYAEPLSSSNIKDCKALRH